MRDTIFWSFVTDRTIHDPRHKQTVTFVTTARESAGEVLAVEVRLGPGGTVPRHVHLRQDERVRVIEGSLVTRVGGRDRVVNAGEVLEVPRRTVHVIRNDGSTEARFALEVRPARRMEAAMRALFFVSRPFARKRV
jgi:quercetin dioxygenase-like cupin family protein